MLTNWNLTIH